MLYQLCFCVLILHSMLISSYQNSEINVRGSILFHDTSGAYTPHAGGWLKNRKKKSMDGPQICSHADVLFRIASAWRTDTSNESRSGSFETRSCRRLGSKNSWLAIVRRSNLSCLSYLSQDRVSVPSFIIRTPNLLFTMRYIIIFLF